MLSTRDPRPCDQQGFDRRYFASNLELVYLPQTASEVVDAWNDAVAKGAAPGELQVTSGRHCYEGFVYNSRTKYIIDTSGLRKIGVDKDLGYYAQPGVSNWDMYRTFNNLYGVTLPAGSCYSVGLGGHVTGGGYGYLSRKFGLTTDHVTAVDMVVKSGNSVEHVPNVSAGNNADLFWAVRGGGGGNFGIVTAYYFESPPVAPTYMATAANVIPWDGLTEDQFGQLLSYYAAVMEDDQKNEDKWSWYHVFHCNHQAAGSMVWTVYAFDAPGSGLEGMEFQAFAEANWQRIRSEVESIAPLSDAPGPVFGQPWHGDSSSFGSSTLRQFTFLEGVQNSNGSGPNRFGKYKSAYMNKGFTAEMVSPLFEGLQAVPPGFDESEMAKSLFQIDSYGCAINKVPSNSTPIPQRSSIMKLQYQTYWDNDCPVGQDDPAQNAAHVNWINDLHSSVYKAYGGFPDPRNDPDGVVDGCYFNYPDIALGVNGTDSPGIDNAMYLYFKENFQNSTPYNLQDVKNKWNPEDWFKGPQSIPLKS